jgi:hypothetical protein
MRTTVTFERNLAGDPQVWFTGSGKQVSELTVLVNQRQQNNEGSGPTPSRPGLWCGRSRPSRRTSWPRWRRGIGSSCTGP